MKNQEINTAITTNINALKESMKSAPEMLNTMQDIAKAVGVVTISGAEFSPCRKYRYALWRIWDETKPFVMFIGLNPSTADESKNDRTIARVKTISEHNGYGGFYMMNCFPYISTDPNMLNMMMATIPHSNDAVNDKWLECAAEMCKTVVFAWGNFEIVKILGKNETMQFLFPNAKALHINKNGSPKHPLYCNANTLFIDYNPTKK
ncbi:MAG: DUF1643 domain-containing protein [Bacteroidota bacterium]